MYHLTEMLETALEAALPPGLAHPPTTDALTAAELRACIAANFRANAGAPAEKQGELLDQVCPRAWCRMTGRPLFMHHSQPFRLLRLGF